MAQTVDLAYEPVALQGTAGTGYDAIDLRRAAIGRGAGQEGVVALGDFKVAQNTGANRFFNIAAGEAFVDGDSVAGQARYYAAEFAAHNAELDVTAADPTNPRIDQVVLEVKDDLHDASGLNKARLRVVTGTPTGGATLDNRSGAAALPSTAIRLADVLMPALAAAVTTANIRDRRPWARGAYKRIVRNANAVAANDYTGPAGAGVWTVDPTNLVPRMELSGAPLRITVRGSMHNNSGNVAGIQFRLGSTVLDSTGGSPHYDGQAGAGVHVPLDAQWDALGHSAGSYTVPMVGYQGGTAQVFFARADIPLQFVVEELAGRVSADNGP